MNYKVGKGVYVSVHDRIDPQSVSIHDRIRLLNRYIIESN